MAFGSKRSEKKVPHSVAPKASGDASRQKELALRASLKHPKSVFGPPPVLKANNG